MIRKICKDEVLLAQKAELATAGDLSVAQDLLETLAAHRENCVGMAANMIGVNKRIIAFDNEGVYMMMFNPEIVRQSSPYEVEEGCLSLPGKSGQVTRPNYAKVHAFNENMEEYEVEGEELLARALLHEIDHLDGHMYTEKVEGNLHDVNYEEEEA